MTSMQRPIDIAIVGCGAITEMGHAPGAMLSPRVRLKTLVDIDIAQARKVAQAHGITDVRTSTDKLEDSVEGVILALPHHLHKPICIEMLGKGLHVLIEKPLGCSVAECEAMTDAAKKAERVLATAMVRRFVSANVMAKQMIEDGTLGKVKSFQIVDADLFSWPIRTPFLVENYPGRGVLIGNGSHIFDLVLWWFGDVETVHCEWDSNLGCETDASIDLTMKSGVTGHIDLSRIRRLDSLIVINFEHGSLRLPRFGSGVEMLSPSGELLSTLEPHSNRLYASNSIYLADLMAAQINDFADAVQGQQQPEVDGIVATDVIRVVEKCVASAQLRPLPWQRPVVMPG